MSRIGAASLLLAIVVCAGCQPIGSRRHVPALYERHGDEIRCVAVYRFRDPALARPPEGHHGRAGLGMHRMDRFEDAGLAARDAVVDLLNGRERLDQPSFFEDRAVRDVSPRFRLRACRHDPHFHVITRSMDEEAGPGLGPNQVQEMARWTGATHIVVGEVERLSADLLGSAGTTVAGQTYISPSGEGVVTCEVRCVLYDARTGTPLLDRCYPESATFRHCDLENPYDKVAYAETCARRLLFNSAWLFVADMLPHYESAFVNRQKEWANKPGPFGPDSGDRQDRYLYLHGR